MKKQSTILRELRESYKLNGESISQRKLATLLHIGYPHISELERGTRTPSLGELKKYHSFFKVSYEYLLGETSEPVSSDVFRENPINESIIDSRIRWLKDPKNVLEKDILHAVEFLLSTEIGLTILFYISRLKFQGKNKEHLLSALEDINNVKTSKLSYAELRMLYDNKNGKSS